MENIKIKSLGPIKEADINFGDLTFFVGPQASGKSIVLQLIKLLADKKSIENKLVNYGYVWGDNPDDNLERFFGEGMSGIWTKRTDVYFDEQSYFKDFLSPQKIVKLNLERDKLFYIPAQRVLTLDQSWPRFFNAFDDSVPYVLRDFSEIIRQYLELGFEDAEQCIFPFRKFGSERFEQVINESIFHDGRIKVDLQKRRRLTLELADTKLPFMTWSTGQKEFMPLLLAFYWLTQVKNKRRKGVNYVIIEEPEMGLHPEAIKSVILQVMDLVERGYKVIVSTHSPVLLEFAWAFNILKEEKASPENFDALFDIRKNSSISPFFTKDLINKTLNTYYFERQKPDDRVIVKNISSLDAGNEDLSIADWGGLSSFASKAGDIISNIVAQNG